MKMHRATVRLLPLGVGPQLAGAAPIVVLLRAGFFRAASTPGGL